MSEKLFRLYRHLSQCKHVDEDNSYTIAWRTVEQVLDNLAELESWGQHIIDTGGIMWDDADKITERIVEHHKTALCEHAKQSSMEAIVDFATTHTSLDEWDELIKRLQAQKEAAEKADRDYKDLLDHLDDHPF